MLAGDSASRQHILITYVVVVSSDNVTNEIRLEYSQWGKIKKLVELNRLASYARGTRCCRSCPPEPIYRVVRIPDRALIGMERFR